MLPHHLKKRLAKLNRGSVAANAGRAATRPSTERPDPLRAIQIPTLSGGITETGRLRVEEVAPGRVIERSNGGAYWLIERRLTDIAQDCDTFISRYAQLLTSPALIVPKGAHRRLNEFDECDPCRVLYLDIETTGLSSACPLFLVGAMEFNGRDFVLKQFFARNYAEEGHLLADFARCLPSSEMLVTFNGNSFDLPYVRGRATVHRVEVSWPSRHLDLLPLSRRRWARELPNCKLATLEEYVCRRRRVDDIPGEQIPAVYHEFVHTADASLIRHVIHHNALDLLTMAELALFMLTGQKDWD